MTSVAELGGTNEPRALVPGNPETVRGEIVLCNHYAASLGRAGDGLKRLDTGQWKGEAAEAFHDAFDGHPLEWIKAGDHFRDAAEVLTSYVEVLEWAQGQAAEAIALWNEAQAATKQAQAEHEATVAHERQRAESSPPGVGSTPGETPFVDPGAERRAAAQDMLHRARMQLIEAGDRAGTTITDLERAAPAKPGAWGQTGEWLSEFGTGLGEWVGDLGEIVTNLDKIPETLSAATTQPMAFAKSLVSWDQFHTNPARWAGHVLPDAALTLVGGVGAVKKDASLAKGFTAAGKAERIMDKAKYNGKGIADHVASKGTDIGRKPDRNKKMPIRLVDDVGELDKVWDGLSRGGTPIERPGYEKIVQMPDGSTVGYRLKPSQGDLGNTLDVRDAANNPLKIHIDPPKG